MKMIKIKLTIITILIFAVVKIGSTNYKANIIKDTITESKLLSLIKELNIAHPKIVITQAKLESANFKSKLFKHNNNLFGMKYPKIRKTTAIGVNRNHAVYLNWRESVIDYKIWQDKYASKYKSKNEYLRYLKRYAQDVNYVEKIKKNLL